MKTIPSLTARAFAMHNAVLRKAAHDHAGHVIEQEGDSWAIAFHDACDAVAFCMQAQQALHRVRGGELGGGMALNADTPAFGSCMPDSMPPPFAAHAHTAQNTRPPRTHITGGLAAGPAWL